MALSETLDTWLDAHTPAGIALAGFTPIMLVATGSQGVASAAVVTGPGAAKDIAASASLAALAKSAPADGRASFVNRPMDGCTSLLNISRVASGFEPSRGMTGDNVAAYARYISSVQKCPLFNIDMNDTVSVARESNDWDQLIAAVADTFDGVQAEDKDKIRDGVKKLVQAAASNSDSAQSEDLFCQSVINSSNDTYEIYIYNSHVQLTDHQSKGHESISENYTISRTKLVFRTTDWPDFAGKVWDKQYSSVDDWLNDNTTPAGDKTALKTCIV